MNQCYGCTTCESADKPLEGFIKNLPLETSHHRVEGQSTKCAFGLQGVCCRLCSNGPCRITPDAPRGICGANADTIVMTGKVTPTPVSAAAPTPGILPIYILSIILYKTLKNAAQKKSGIKGEGALNKLAALFEIEEEDMYVRAEKVADAVLADLYLPEYEKMKLVKKMAYAPRYENWEKLGILPGGAKSEVCHGVVKCSTNLNSDPVDMLKDCLKLGISG